MVTVEQLLLPAGPWVHEIKLDDFNLFRPRLESHGGRIVELCGERMTTLEGLFAEYARAYKFPAYFGGNWAAYYECMTGLEEVPAHSYLTVIAQSESVLERDSVESATFQRQLDGIGRSWATSFGLGAARNYGEVPFHTLLVKCNIADR